MIGSRKKKIRPSVAFDPNVAAKIHVMPKRFYAVPTKSRAGVIIGIVVAIIVIGGLSTAVYFFLPSLSKPEPQPNTNVVPEPVVNINVNTNTNEGAVTEPRVQAPPVINTNTSANINVNTSVSTNSSISSSGPLPSGPDSDNDKLTDAEEALFGTNPNSNDSDQDSYLDGNEIVAGFDPTKPGVALADSGLFETYTTSDVSMIYPAPWQAKVVSGDVIFQSSGQEFVQIIEIDNVDELLIRDWYAKQFPGSNVALTTSVRINNLNGLRSVDKQNYYIASISNDRVYVISYSTGSLSRANFLTTFNVMVSSFKLIN